MNGIFRDTSTLSTLSALQMIVTPWPMLYIAGKIPVEYGCKIPDTQSEINKSTTALHANGSQAKPDYDQRGNSG